MKNFKKDVQAFLDKNHIQYKDGTPERLYQDLYKLKSEKKVKPDPGSDKYRSTKYTSKLTKRQLGLF